MGFSPTGESLADSTRKRKGIYVPDNELVRLSLITFEERRETNCWFDIFVDVRKYGWEGVFKMQNEKWKAIQGLKMGVASLNWCV
jgi:hypothetical protein